MPTTEPTREIRRVLVVGAGTMGRGIAALCVARGFETSIHDAIPAAAAAAPAAIGDTLARARARGRMSEAEETSARRLLAVAPSLSAAGQVDLVIEAAPESLDVKRALFAEIDRAPEPVVLATNTSSLSIAKIAAATSNPGRVLGLHFFNPAPVMPLVEIVVGPATSPAATSAARAFVAALGKEAILVRDAPGFATSRLGLVLGLEAMRMVEEGVATAADIDRAMEAGYGHAMGPLKTSDLVGLDVRLAIAETLAAELSDARFDPPAILRALVAQGKTGKKAGEGFYRWEGNVPVTAGGTRS
jgi:3-hydroxybutyryl-CoA dehydrogenase